jgi:hypothetical protein
VRKRKPPSPRPSDLVPPFRGLSEWWLASAGVEAQRVVSVGRTRWTVCYKVHVIPARRREFKASITLWPRGRRRIASRRRTGGWNSDLLQHGWYDSSALELRRHGYRGTWQWSPWGRFGDFWKDLTSMKDLVAEVRILERLRNTLKFALERPSNNEMQRTKHG